MDVSEKAVQKLSTKGWILHFINCIFAFSLTFAISKLFEYLSNYYWDVSLGTSDYYLTSNSIFTWSLPGLFIGIQLSIFLISSYLKKTNKSLWQEFVDGPGKGVGVRGTIVINVLIVLYLATALTAHVALYNDKMIIKPFLSVNADTFTYQEVTELLYCKSTKGRNRNGTPVSDWFINLNSNKKIQLDNTVLFVSDKKKAEFFSLLRDKTGLKMMVYDDCNNF